MEDALKENMFACEGLKPAAYILTEEEKVQIAAEKIDRLYGALRKSSAAFAAAALLLVAVFKLNEDFFDARSRIGIKMESMNAQAENAASPKINVKTSFRDEKKARLVMPLPVPIENEMVNVCEEFTQSKYVITLRGYSEHVPNGLELASDSTIMEAVGVYRRSNDIVVEVYCRDAYDCTIETGGSGLVMNFKPLKEDYAAKAVVWLPYEDKNRLAFPEWKQELEEFAAYNNIRLYMAPDMHEEYTQSDVAAFANRVGADMVLGVDVVQTEAQQAFITGICNTLYFIPDYNSTHLSVAMTEIFAEATQIRIRGFGIEGEYDLVSAAEVPVAVVRLSVPQKELESIESEYKLNQKIAASLKKTMGGILDNYLKTEEKTDEG